MERRSLADRLFPVRRTLMEMLRDRGFLVSDDDIAMTWGQFIERFGIDFRKEVLDFSRSKGNNPSDAIYVFFVEEKLGKTPLEAYINKMNSSNVTRAIFVVQEKPNILLHRALSYHVTKHLEVFTEQELLVNISKHYLVPKHEVLTDNEKKLLLKRYHAQLTQLPSIQVTDPMARYLGLVQGDVVKITRKSETVGTYVTYRAAV